MNELEKLLPQNKEEVLAINKLLTKMRKERERKEKISFFENLIRADIDAAIDEIGLEQTKILFRSFNRELRELVLTKWIWKPLFKWLSFFIAATRLFFNCKYLVWPGRWPSGSAELYHKFSSMSNFFPKKYIQNFFLFSRNFVYFTYWSGKSCVV